MVRLQGQPVALQILGEYVWHHFSEEARSPTQEERWLQSRRCALTVEPFGDTNLLVAMPTATHLTGAARTTHRCRRKLAGCRDADPSGTNGSRRRFVL